MSNRYEVRKVNVSAVLRERFPELPTVAYRVWDRELDKRVPFGGHGTRESAERHAARLEAKP